MIETEGGDMRVLAIAILLWLAGYTGYGRMTRTPQPSWEYLVIRDPTAWNPTHGAKELNELGEQGWGLVGVSSKPVGDGRQTHTRLFLKRAKY